jgi:hypothetical protein
MSAAALLALSCGDTSAINGSCALDGRYIFRLTPDEPACGAVARVREFHNIDVECSSVEDGITLSCVPGDGRTYECDGTYVEPISGCSYAVSANHLDESFPANWQP